MAPVADDDSKKRHNKRAAGRKADKKTKKNPHVQELTAKQRNPRAFTVRSTVNAAKSIHRTEDIKQRKLHVPIIDRTGVEPPPIVVTIVGPPQVGKSTLLRCLVKNFTRKTLTNVQGPVTIVSGKKRRITLIECNNDINSMIDLAKVTDLVLLMVDASFGFEMETFEFLNICQVHGFPRVMGVLTHLDMFRDNKKLRKIKKTLKHRFWTDVYPGAKLFYLSGMVHGDYQRLEVHNLGRFISVMKFRPLDWRQNHPYLLIDRVEDVTEPEHVRQQPLCDRRVCLYGYVRGVPLRADTPVHLAGVGDFQLAAVDFLPDPCPLPERAGQGGGRKMRRSLNELERLLYAPMSGVGGIVYDKDAVYIDLKGSHSHGKPGAGEAEDSGEVGGALEDEEEQEDDQLKRSLRESRQTLDQLLETAELQVMAGETAVQSHQVQQQLEQEELAAQTAAASAAAAKQRQCQLVVSETGRTRRRVMFDEDEPELANDDDDDEEGESDRCPGEASEDDQSEDEDRCRDSVRSEDTLTVSGSFDNCQTAKQLRRLIYDEAGTLSASGQSNDVDKRHGDDEELGGLFRRRVSVPSGGGDAMADARDSELPQSRHLSSNIDWEHAQHRLRLAGKFIAVDAEQATRAAALLALDSDGFDASAVTAAAGDDDEVDGDFEDLETGEKHTAKRVRRASASEEDESDGEQLEQQQEEEESLPVKAEDEQLSRRQRIERKKQLKRAFDTEYDTKESSGFYDDLKRDLEQQAQLNVSEFDGLDERERVRYEGFRVGMYVRLELAQVACELVQHLDCRWPLVLGGLAAGEQTAGFLQARVKRHRWYGRTLKTRDPLTVSLGWRRFQTVPLYSSQDHNGRHRSLKYTPDHLHCMAHFFGPLTPQGSGVLAVSTCPPGPDADAQPARSATAGFRVSLTGVVLDLDKSVRVQKKLKLVGEPRRVSGKTAFVTGMFSSAVEAARFEGALCRTVSGVRGHVKRALLSQPGQVRCTFEDRIKVSDLVFVRTWCVVPVPRLYVPVVSLLLPAAQRHAGWPQMKTLAQLKRERGLRTAVDSDQLYTDVQRKPPAPAQPLRVPSQLLKQLPYTDKLKLATTTTTTTAGGGGGGGGAARGGGRAAAGARLVRQRDGQLVAPSVQRQPVAVVLQPREQKLHQLLAGAEAVHQLQQQRRQQQGRARADAMLQRHQQRLSKFDQRQKKVRKHLFRVLAREKQGSAKRKHS